MIAAGLPRTTGDIDLVVATDPINESRVYAALATLPDNAVGELGTGELDRYPVIRVADEIVIDLMRSAGGITYDEALLHTVVRNIQGIDIPFASPRLLWRMKRVTHREKDIADLAFLRLWFSENNELPPD